jgi:hypothetical protein
VTGVAGWSNPGLNKKLDPVASLAMTTAACLPAIVARNEKIPCRLATR